MEMMFGSRSRREQSNAAPAKAARSSGSSSGSIGSPASGALDLVEASKMWLGSILPGSPLRRRSSSAALDAHVDAVQPAAAMQARVQRQQSAGDRLSALEKMSLRRHKSPLVPSTPPPPQLPPVGAASKGSWRPSVATRTPPAPVRQHTRLPGSGASNKDSFEPPSVSSSCAATVVASSCSSSSGSYGDEDNISTPEQLRNLHGPLCASSSGSNQNHRADRDYSDDERGGGGRKAASTTLLPNELLSGSPDELRARLVAMAQMCEREHERAEGLARELAHERLMMSGERRAFTDELRRIRAELILAQSEQRLLEAKLEDSNSLPSSPQPYSPPVLLRGAGAAPVAPTEKWSSSLHGQQYPQQQEDQPPTTPASTLNTPGRARSGEVPAPAPTTARSHRSWRAEEEAEQKGLGTSARTAATAKLSARAIVAATTTPAFSAQRVVSIRKPEASTRLGLVFRRGGLSGDRVLLSRIAESGLGFGMAGLRVGQTLHAVNGELVLSHVHASQLLKAASGEVHLLLSDAPGATPPAPQQQVATPLLVRREIGEVENDGRRSIIKEEEEEEAQEEEEEEEQQEEEHEQPAQQQRSTQQQEEEEAQLVQEEDQQDQGEGAPGDEAEDQEEDEEEEEEEMVVEHDGTSEGQEEDNAKLHEIDESPMQPWDMAAAAAIVGNALGEAQKAARGLVTGSTPREAAAPAAHDLDEDAIVQDWLPIYDGWDASRHRRVKVGSAPMATRPDWLAASGAGMANVPPLEWSLTVAQLAQFLAACRDSPTWTALGEARGGERLITMDDVIVHFAEPWSRGTGCSIALLMNHDEPQRVQIMLSRSWAGPSALSTYEGLVQLPDQQAAVFFSALCLYHPQDEAPGSLSMDAQLDQLIKALADSTAAPEEAACQPSERSRLEA